MGGSSSQEAAAEGGSSPAKAAPTAPTTTGSTMTADAAAFLPSAAALETVAPVKTGGGGKGEKGGEKGKQSKAPTGTQICVRQLPKDAKEEDLRKQFEGFGKITEVALKTLKNGQGKGYGFITFSTAEEAEKAIEAMHEKEQPEGKPLLVTKATRQPGEAKGKGKDGKDGGEKGKGKDGKGGKGKGKAKGQPAAAAAYQYPYYGYPYSQEQIQQAWAMHQMYYQQAQAYYSGFTGGVIPSEAAISAASAQQSASTQSSKKETVHLAEEVAPRAFDKEYTGQVKSISSKNGYGFITCDEFKETYGRDVFVDASLLPDIEVKSKVTFTVELSDKGHPRANKVTKIADAED